MIRKMTGLRYALPAAALALAVIGGGTAYAVTAAGTSAVAAPGALYGCLTPAGAVVNATTVASKFKGCPKGDKAFTVASIPGKRGPQGPPGPTGAAAISSVSGAVSVRNHGDSSNFGKWALDQLTVSMTLTNEGRVPVSDCSAEPGVTSCFFYTATVARTGTFQTLHNYNSPAAGKPVSLSVPLSGSMTGTATVEFFYSRNNADPKNLPATALDEKGSPYGSPDSIGYTLAGFFKGDLSKPGVNPLPFSGTKVTGYTWNYGPTSATCETWIDSSSNSDGSVAPYGTDIAGVRHC